MRWEDERYVRVYTRDTPEWVALSWEARAVFVLLLRVADRAGIIPLGRKGMRGLAAMLHMPVDVLERATLELCEDGCITDDSERICIPNFIEAQETRASDAQRKRDQRERARDKALSVFSPDLSQNVTKSHISSHAVTTGHTESHAVTPSRAVPSRAEPCRTEPGEAPPVGELRDGLDATFQKQRGHKYRWRSADEDALRDVMDQPTEEILRRWGIALRRVGYPRCDTVRDLVKHWNAYAAEASNPARDKPKSTTDPNNYDWTDGGGFDELNKGARNG